MPDLPYPPLHTSSPFMVLSDWDGTITMMDSNDYLTDNLGYGKEKRRAQNLAVLHGSLSFQENFREMMESVKVPFEECKEILRKNIKLDPGFKAFYKWAKAHDVPVVIVSSGMEPLIRAVLSNLLSPEEANEIEIISNDVKYTDPEGKGTEWEIVFRNPDSHFGHDKSKAILPYRDLSNPPTIFFMGDGVSDLSAASHADVLFVKDKGGENDLEDYVIKNSTPPPALLLPPSSLTLLSSSSEIPHIMFKSFDDCTEVVSSIVEGKKTVKEVLGGKTTAEAAQE